MSSFNDPTTGVIRQLAIASLVAVKPVIIGHASSQIGTTR